MTTIEDYAIARVTLQENLALLDSDYDRLILILNLLGWKQSHIAEVTGGTKQSISHIIRKCKKRLNCVDSGV